MDGKSGRSTGPRSGGKPTESHRFEYVASPLGGPDESGSSRTLRTSDVNRRRSFGSSNSADRRAVPAEVQSSANRLHLIAPRCNDTRERSTQIGRAHV